MNCSAFIATSLDGYIAAEDHGIGWLDACGNAEADMSATPDMGFNTFISNIDCLIMGRGTIEVLQSMDLKLEQWPYGDRQLIALSHTLPAKPGRLPVEAEVWSDGIPELMVHLEGRGFKHAYVDGGKTISSFIKLRLLENITLTTAPILLGGGIPLFDDLDTPVQLEEAEAFAYPNDFVQRKYRLRYD